MSLRPADAEDILRARLGEPINPVKRGPRKGEDNKKVLGFATPTGLVLALNREIRADTHIWLQPPAAPEIDGVHPKLKTAKNHNLTGRLKVLAEGKGRQVIVESEGGLKRFLDWYVGSRSRRV